MGTAGAQALRVLRGWKPRLRQAGCARGGCFSGQSWADHAGGRGLRAEKGRVFLFISEQSGLLALKGPVPTGGGPR